VSAFDLVIARIAARQHWVISGHQLLAAGLSNKAIAVRVSDGRLYRVHRGVYGVGGPPRTATAWRMAAVLAVGRGALVSHRSAAAAWGIRGTARAAVDVVALGRCRRQREGITVHVTRTLHPEDRAVVDRVPTTSLARTLLDLAEVVGPTALRRAYDRAEHLRLLDARSLDLTIARANGRRGVSALRAVREHDPVPGSRTKSELERLFLDLVRDGRLPMPLVNVHVEGYEIDAFWPDAKLAVELQSWTYHRNPATFERDHQKAARLKAAGYEFLALTYGQVTEEGQWVAGALRSLLAKPLSGLVSRETSGREIAGGVKRFAP